MLATKGPQDTLLLVDLRLCLGALRQRQVQFAGHARLRLAFLGALALGGGNFLPRLDDALLVFARFAGAQRDELTQFLEAAGDRLALLLPGLALLGLGGQFDARFGHGVVCASSFGGDFVQLGLQFRHLAFSASCGPPSAAAMASRSRSWCS